mmetsp:Transcript_7383/g.18335  ORF Transcript_7383/g.18335 Transcript_7383/m.18335 type:complete len:236 (+) Transcript_7383:1093-1800(+)
MHPLHAGIHSPQPEPLLQSRTGREAMAWHAQHCMALPWPLGSSPCHPGAHQPAATLPRYLSGHGCLGGRRAHGRAAATAARARPARKREVVGQEGAHRDGVVQRGRHRAVAVHGHRPHALVVLLPLAHQRVAPQVPQAHAAVPRAAHQPVAGELERVHGRVVLQHACALAAAHVPQPDVAVERGGRERALVKLVRVHLVNVPAQQVQARVGLQVPHAHVLVAAARHHAAQRLLKR